MVKRKLSIGISVVLMSLMLLAGCAAPSQPASAPIAAPASNEPVQMQYISREEVKYAITSVQKDYVLLDVRKSADYDASHIINAVSADMDAAKSNGDDATGTANLKAALKKATGKEDGKDKKIVLLCYSGGKYAETAARLLSANGIDAARIFTLKGGYEGWTKEDKLGEYQYLLDAVALAAKTNEPNVFTTKLLPMPRTSDLYLLPEEVKTLMETKEISNYYLIDTRSQSEYEDGHIVTAHNAPDFVAANKGDLAPRNEVVENVKAMFAKYPYAQGKKLILICRGGKGGTQNMDDVLREEFKIDNDLIYTLQYGHGAFPESWSKLGAAYKRYVVKGTEPGTVATQ